MAKYRSKWQKVAAAKLAQKKAAEKKSDVRTAQRSAAAAYRENVRRPSQRPPKIRARSRHQREALKRQRTKFDIAMMPITNSTNIAAIGYDPETRIMKVQFLSGSTYAYYGVSKERFDKVMKGLHRARYPYPHYPSVGSAFWEYIRRAGIRYEKLS